MAGIRSFIPMIKSITISLYNYYNIKFSSLYHNLYSINALGKVLSYDNS